MIEEGLAGRQPGPHQPVGLIEPAQGGMPQERQEIQAGEDCRQLLLAVTQVVFEMVALGLEGVVVLVLDLPAGPPGSDQAGDVGLVDRPVGDPGVVIDRVALGVGDADFAPVDLESVLALGQGGRRWSSGGCRCGSWPCDERAPAGCADPVRVRATRSSGRGRGGTWAWR